MSNIKPNWAWCITSMQMSLWRHRRIVTTLWAWSRYFPLKQVGTLSSRWSTSAKGVISELAGDMREYKMAKGNVQKMWCRMGCIHLWGSPLRSSSDQLKRATLLRRTFSCISQQFVHHTSLQHMGWVVPVYLLTLVKCHHNPSEHLQRLGGYSSLTFSTGAQVRHGSLDRRHLSSAPAVTRTLRRASARSCLGISSAALAVNR